MLRINVNGYFANDVPKMRGLRQGDPISSILYGLAIKSFLQSILNDPLYYSEYQMQYASDHPNCNAAEPVIHVSKILCYADNAFVFVKDPPGLARLHYSLDVHCQATNAKINYKKVKAFSLSGQNTWIYWRAKLTTDMHIIKLTSNMDANPMIHKATVLNSPKLAKCWYVLRVTLFARPDIQAIQAIRTTFFRKGIFSVIPMATGTKAKSLGGLGGLGVLDVGLQQSALNFCRIQPLLYPTDSSHILDLMLAMLVNQHNQSAYVQVLMLFSLTQTTTGLTKQSANRLPVKAILQPSVTVSRMPSKVAQLDVKDFFPPNPDQPPQLEARKEINQDEVRVQPFFGLLPLQPPQDGTKSTIDNSFQPFTDSYDFRRQQGLQQQITTKTFRKTCIEACTSNIATHNWHFFWSLSLTLVNRNVIYRFITNTIPAKRLLHYFKIAESPLCSICDTVKNAVNMLFLCPSEVSIWKAIIFEFLWPTVSMDYII